MRYKRDESFRYEFGKPLECEIKLLRINDKEVNSSEGKAKIHDISPNGLKISSDLDLLSKENDVMIEICFTLLSENIMIGEIIWQKDHFTGEYFYGVELRVEAAGRDDVIDQLKGYIHREKTNQ